MNRIIFLITFSVITGCTAGDVTDTGTDSNTDTTQNSDGCDSCHGLPPATGRHLLHANKGYKCNTCHSEVVDSSNDIIDDSLHINGTSNVSLIAGTYDGGSCSNVGCHETKSW